MKADKPFIPGWIILILAIGFFPIAIVLLIVRAIGNSKKNHLREGDIRMTGHTLIVTWAALSFWINIADTEPSGTGTMLGVIVVLGVPIAIPGLIFYWSANRRRQKMEQLYTRYYALVCNDGIRSIERISALTKQSVANVTQDLDYMIRFGKMPEAYIDYNAKMVVAPGIDGGAQDRFVNEGATISVNAQSAPGGANVTVEVSSGRTSASVRHGVLSGQSGQQEAASGTANSAAAAPHVVPAMPVTVNCSGCGASAQLIPGERKQCEFCGNGLQVGA